MRTPTAFYILHHQDSAGFGSEVNNLLYGIYFFERHGLDYCLSSINWVSAYREGWCDYFESLRDRHTALPYRWGLIDRLLHYSQRQRLRQSPKTYRRINRRILTPLLYALCTDRCYLRGRPTFSVIRRYARRQRAKDGAAFHAHIHSIASRIWVPRPAIVALAATCVPDIPYVAVHIRRGDKVETGEDRSYALHEYELAIRRVAGAVREVFLMTDDRRLIEAFCDRLPEFRVHTLPGTATGGYSQDMFKLAGPEGVRTSTIHLIAELEIARHAEVFVGTFRSNIFRLLDYLRPGGCIDISAEQAAASEL